jgi:hypothetical protein
MWNPLISQSYIGVIWHVFILLIAQSSGEITNEQNTFLSSFLNMFPLQNLPVPGPLVPFFRSLGVCSGPYEHFGDVTPRIPGPTGTRVDYYFHTNGLNRTIPPVHIFVDQLCFLANLNANIIAQANNFPIRIYTNILGNNVPAAAAPANPFDIIGYFPGVANRWLLSPSHMQVWHANRLALNLPTRMSTIAAIPNTVHGPNRALTLSESLRFSTANINHPQWFVSAISVMQRYSQFFAGSTSLAGIPIVGFGASVPLWIAPAFTQRIGNRAPTYITAPTHSSTPAVPVAMNYLTWLPAANQGCTAETGDPTLIPNQDGSDPNRLARQFSAATQVNIDLSAAGTGPLYSDQPPNAVLRTGPLWPLSVVSRSTAVDNTINSGQNILGMFVADTRLP